MSIYESVESRVLIEKGWSGDRKYRAVAAGGESYLLRISLPQRMERKQEEFARMQQVAALGIPMCRPIEFGTCEEGVYSLQSWVDGVDAAVSVVDLHGEVGESDEKLVHVVINRGVEISGVERLVRAVIVDRRAVRHHAGGVEGQIGGVGTESGHGTAGGNGEKTALGDEMFNRRAIARADGRDVRAGGDGCLGVDEGVVKIGGNENFIKLTHIFDAFPFVHSP